ncbi:uncharacterized protein MYCFIDRAFT_178932 [Pseudocercospora fijiensis CIRAD86]|uniref:Uncharacterized protein n=1 Tax=Pseudocercospora fijiensis (strain CIRAD86) TaxID=383855 RepID=M3A2X3_PSEFD|nr:uncharacterized protein MYCFIDRAFT_178932 [Pseudocercospora fijiensis CIRAD86]EME78841.1 hypothetical protein MYCFIDRAFT_178932 [Pseudocercospora fijiensis CIRAD86]
MCILYAGSVRAGVDTLHCQDLRVSSNDPIGQSSLCVVQVHQHHSAVPTCTTPDLLLDLWWSMMADRYTIAGRGWLLTYSVLHNALFSCLVHTSASGDGSQEGAAWGIVRVLREMADAGKAINTIIEANQASVHQPRSEVSSLLDLCVIMPRGSVLRSGSTVKCLAYRDTIGYPTPEHKNRSHTNFNPPLAPEPVMLWRTMLNYRRSLSLAILLALFFTHIGQDTDQSKSRLRLFCQASMAQAAQKFLQRITVCLLLYSAWLLITGLPRTPEFFFSTAHTTLSVVSCVESVGPILLSFINHDGLAIAIMAALLCLSMSLRGTLSINLPAWIDPLDHISPAKWEVQVSACAETIDLTSCTALSGKDVPTLYGVKKFLATACGILLGLVIGHRLVAFMVIKPTYLNRSLSNCSQVQSHNATLDSQLQSYVYLLYRPTFPASGSQKAHCIHQHQRHGVMLRNTTRSDRIGVTCTWPAPSTASSENLVNLEDTVDRLLAWAITHGFFAAAIFMGLVVPGLTAVIDMKFGQKLFWEAGLDESVHAIDSRLCKLEDDDEFAVGRRPDILVVKAGVGVARSGQLRVTQEDIVIFDMESGPGAPLSFSASSSAGLLEELSDVDRDLRDDDQWVGENQCKRPTEHEKTLTHTLTIYGHSP